MFRARDRVPGIFRRHESVAVAKLTTSQKRSRKTVEIDAINEPRLLQSDHRYATQDQLGADLHNARWSEFDLVSGVWKLDPERRKGGKVGHTVVLPRQALTFLQTREYGAPSDLVFIGARGGALANWDREAKKINKDLGLDPWSAHSMRRTTATLAGKTGTPPHVISALLGHASIGGDALQSSYNHSRYEKDVGEALQRVADALDTIEQGGESFIDFRKA